MTPTNTTLDQLNAAGINQSTVGALGTRIGITELGDGPMVLFVHGFPESWYSWRNQMIPVAEAGWKAVAIDVRGYGRSSAPSYSHDYGMVHHVADNVGVVRALSAGDTKVVVVGHDWGSPIAWTSALMRPDIFDAVALLSVPYSPRGNRKPSEAFRDMGGREQFYIEYFDHPNKAEGEIELDIAHWLLGMYYSASGDGIRAMRAAGLSSRAAFLVEYGGKLSDRFVWPDEGVWPTWMSEDDFNVYVGEFERTGFSGGLNRYRNADNDWHNLAALYGAPIGQPSLFIGGELDGPTVWGAPAIEKFPTTMPGLLGKHIIEESGHWVQQEASDEVTGHLLEFLAEIRRIAR